MFPIFEQFNEAKLNEFVVSIRIIHTIDLHSFHSYFKSLDLKFNLYKISKLLSIDTLETGKRAQ